jgi:hypothetical protein
VCVYLLGLVASLLRPLLLHARAQPLARRLHSLHKLLALRLRQHRSGQNHFLIHSLRVRVRAWQILKTKSAP